MEDRLHDDEESPDSSSSRRIWKRPTGAQGSSQLTLKAMAVLYDAGQPLSRDELADRLLPRLDTYARWYLAAWYQRRLQQMKKWNDKRRGVTDSITEVPVMLSDSRTTDPVLALKRWLTEVFANRARQGSLIRDPDGRFRPGPKTPRAQTMDGVLVKFTPEKRRELEQGDHDRGRTHLTQLEFQRAIKTLDFSSPEARAQLLCFLARHLFTSDAKFPLTERQLKTEFKHLVHIADTPAVKEAVLRLALEYLLKGQA